jgi:hypothetical protein
MSVYAALTIAQYAEGPGGNRGLTGISTDRLWRAKRKQQDRAVPVLSQSLPGSQHRRFA